jgi:hypothetical protein
MCVCVCVDQVSVNFLVQREERGELVSLAPLRFSRFRVVFSPPQPGTWYPFVDAVLTRVFSFRFNSGIDLVTCSCSNHCTLFLELFQSDL